jgi:hypothetical protein
VAVSASLVGVQSSPGVDARAHRVASSAAFAGTSGNTPRAGLIPTYGTGFTVTPAGGLSVSVGSGAVVLPAPQAGHGAWHVVNDAALTITLDAAHASNARIDLIIARVADPFYTSGGDGLPAIKKITGTPSSSPLPPTVPATEGVYEVIKQVTVPSVASGITNLTDSHIADLAGDALRYTAAVGAVLSVANTAERDAAFAAGSVYPGMSVFVRDVEERHELTGSASFGARWLRNKAWTTYTPTAARDSYAGANNNPLTWASQFGWYRIVDSVVEGSVSLTVAGNSDPYDAGSNFRITLPATASATVRTVVLTIGSWKEFYGNGSYSDGTAHFQLAGGGQWMVFARQGTGAGFSGPLDWYRDFSNYVGAAPTIFTADFHYPVD